MPTQSIAVLVLLETDDPRLDPDKLDNSTASKAAAVRRAVIENLPKLSRVVVVMPEEAAQMMMGLYDYMVREMGGETNPPPPGYVPPTRD